jgi:hypothetical protein
MTTEAAEWISGITKEDIGRFAEEEREIRIGRVHSGDSYAKDHRQQFARRVSGLLGLYGIEKPAEWRERIEAARGTQASGLGAVGDREYDKFDVRRWSKGKELGVFIMDQAFWAVPLEGSEDEDGKYELTLQLEPDVFATFRCHGEQELSRHYIDRETREVLTGDARELEERALNGEVDTDIAALHTNIDYSVLFSRTADPIK